MRKKRMWMLGLAAALSVGTLLGAAVIVLKHEPSFYTRGDIPPGPERKRLSSQFVEHFGQLLIDASVDRGQWGYAFSEAEINSFFAEDFVHSGEAENLRRLGVSEPRVILEDDRMRFAFRYGSGFWSTVLSYDVKLWITPKEPNVLAVEILGRRAGSLPISSQSLLNELSEVAARHNMDVTAYRHDNHPVALIRFQVDRVRPTTYLKCLKVNPASLTIAGSSAEALQQGLQIKNCVTPNAN